MDNNSHKPRPEPLVNAAAWATGNLTSVDRALAHRVYDVLDRVIAERFRQDALLAAGHHRWTCASPDIGDDRKLRILVEEVGEVAQAIDLLEGALARGGDGGLERVQLRDELVQVAAVAVAWLESMNSIERMNYESADPCHETH